MNAITTIHHAAETAWEALKRHGVPPLPRNFEIMYAYHCNEKPSLKQRIDKILADGQPLKPETLDMLYRDFFAYTVDPGVIRDGSRELRSIADELNERVSADRGRLDEFSTVLEGITPSLESSHSLSSLRDAAGALKAVSTEAGDRFRALEQLFAASVMRIGELKQALARAEREATCDALTGLANRRMFDAALLHATVTASRDGDPVALLMLDIDHFKKFNDKYGHPLGDNVLRLFAQVLTNHIKGRDTAARYGGEEFAIILVGANISAAMTVGEQIRNLLEHRPIINRNTGQKLGVVTCSIGAAVFRPGETMTAFVQRADTALYEAKKTGRNRVCAEAAG